MTSIRTQLTDALQLDLVGPTPEQTEYAQEILTQSPAKWYLTGFLVPFNAPLEERSDPTAGEEMDLQEGSPSNEDGSAPEKAAARQTVFPSSMGLSFLVPETVKELEVEVSWGDYIPIESEDGEDNPEGEQSEEPKEPKEPKVYWQRYPRQERMRVSLSQTQPLEIADSHGLQLVVANRPVKFKELQHTRSVSVFLVNKRSPKLEQFKQARESAYIFQAALKLSCSEGFYARRDLRQGNPNDLDEQVARVQYHQDYEFAVGHNVSAIAVAQGENCYSIATTWIPTAEVPRVAPRTLDNVKLGMEAISDAPDAASLREMLAPLITEYGQWIETQRQQSCDPELESIKEKMLQGAAWTNRRMAAGLESLDDPQVLQAFQMANRAIARARRQQLSQEQEKDPSSFEAPQWRPFQLAFILLNLVSMAQPEQTDPANDRETVDLLFFPTGGGKTEAYLGLAAFTLVLRRLRHPGIQGCGLSVLMRYTLRLLTLDQLERASRLICALELERREHPQLLGEWPFEIGLWVGQGATPNKMGKKGDKDERSARARTLALQKGTWDQQGAPIPLERCPWCGETLNSQSFQLFPHPDQPQELRIHCPSRKCAFRADHPLPIVAVDESIYRRLPCFMIATVDKFASLPWVGQTAALFGKVTHYQPAQGFFSAADSQPRGQSLTEGLPPPDLVIQDELHLISGPLGTMVGLYETAIDALCTRPGEGGRPIHPKIIASTATVRRADRQIQALFGRQQVEIFPPPGPDRHDSFFAQTVFPDQSPGRLYVGVAAQGRSLKVVLLRTYLALLASAQQQWEEAGGKKVDPNPADPYMTLLGYFNSLRELGGSRRIIEDEVHARLSQYGSRLRYGQERGPFSDRKIENLPEELTSRVSTSQVAKTKRRLALSFNQRSKNNTPVDIALATNMISVGLDIVRLGLMVVLGQPKTAAEYIQSTSRVGRDPQRPGLVVTLLNIHRPRDRSHYERFQSWHASFYRAVEATSVTPFSPPALDRGLAAVLVALCRLSVPELTPPLGAGLIQEQQQKLDSVVDWICDRVEVHKELDEVASENLRKEVKKRVQNLLDTWQIMGESQSKRFQYNRYEEDGVAALLLDASDPEAHQKPSNEQKFKAQRSLRDVEPTVALWVRE